MGAYGVIWGYVGFYRVVRRCMGLNGVYGAMWGYMGICGDI